MTEQQIRERIREFTRLPAPAVLRIHTDTTQFMDIRAGDCILVEDRIFYVRGEEFEGRFGLDGEPKFWVKRVVDLADGSRKIVKLAFFESFHMRLGEERIRCFRSPHKESRILEKTAGDVRFMQGRTFYDTAGNPVRVLERISGKPFYDIVLHLDMDHETYYYEVFPAIFSNLMKAFYAVRDLHREGEIHGDIRNDHLLVESGTGRYRWIDFDYTFDWPGQPYGVDLFGLGNILLFAAGMGFHTLHDLQRPDSPHRHVVPDLRDEDFSLFFPHRLMNLKKIFPHIRESLNKVLMHFATGAEVFYESAQEMVEDLEICFRSFLWEVPHGA
ncbi:hypothetical protein SAMN02745206_00028 [Desulfacinum infernum DSM 9756]|uniref:Protein kinase domain-containing protein n=1 Tax=Desulfacinum infernum DSM 9756 TaxID=1121391 RepID=A0A1M4S9J5_9BACT|nr:hypothetical protein [Desulfacinum infernum]SHE28871.1 hypothetical protein SAMN02745206_00028 [Desulfacinum infernum DSM 9756]